MFLEQFRICSRTVSEQFQSSFRAVSEQFQMGFGAIFFGAVQGNFRAPSVDLECSGGVCGGNRQMSSQSRSIHPSIK